MAVVLVNQGGADGSPPEGRYLQSFDPDWTPPGSHPPFPMTGRAVWTDDVAKAKRFPDFLAALAEWKRPSTVLPIRPWDGQPNRPLTAYTVKVETV